MLQPFSQPTESYVAIATLGSALICRNADTRAKRRGENFTLGIGERTAPLDFEYQLGSSVRGIGMLPAGTARGTEAPLEFVVGNCEVGIDLQ